MLGNRQRLSVMNMGGMAHKELYTIYIVGEKIELKFFLGIYFRNSHIQNHF